MGVLIDASVLIEHERKRLDLDQHLNQREAVGRACVARADDRGA
jgi:hypothetical protein